MKLNKINDVKVSKIKLTIKYTITTLIIVILLMLSFYLIYSNSMYKNFDLNLQNRAISIASTLIGEEESSFEELKSISSIIKNYNLGNESILILDSNGNILYEIIQENISLPDKIKTGFYNLLSKEDEEQKKVRAYITKINNSDFYLLVAKNYDDLISSLNNVLISFLLAIPFVFVITLILSYRFANEAIKPIEESIKRLKQFTTDASHELKTPISTIKANIEVALMKDREPSYYKEKLSTILNSINRMSKLIQNMLYISKLDTSSYKLNIENFNLKDLFNEIKLNFEDLAFSKKVSLIIDDKNSFNIKNDKDILFQILSILVENAIEYNRENGFVKIYSKLNKDFIKIFVEDSGIGVKKEDIPYIFDRFYRGEKSRSRETGGLGLGLSIVKELVNIANGKIFVESELGKGSKFIIVIKKETYGD